MANATMTFPPDFRWGTTTSAYQTEGNITNSDWSAWETSPDNPFPHTAGSACNWWENAEADLDRAAAMGVNAHRLSLEWSRIEPEPSVFNAAALDRYRQILQAMQDRNIEPMVSLHHFSNPLWLSEKEDFHSRVVVDYFQRYTTKVVDELGDLIPKWVTINDPMVYVFMRYLKQRYPKPVRTGWNAAREAVGNLLRCHAAAYQVIKDKRPSAQVGTAKNMAVFEPRQGGSLLDKWWAGRVNRLFNIRWLDALANGRFYSLNIKGLANAFDFIGINYATRFYVKFPPRNELLDSVWPPNAVMSDDNYSEIYPAGLYKTILTALPYKKPIYITENGLPDAADRLRPSFILTHLREVWRGISFCFPIMGYYHKNLIDSFEWSDGWNHQFGLIELDTATQERRLRPSAHLYSEICQSGSISSKMAERYAPALMKTMFRGNAPS